MADSGQEFALRFAGHFGRFFGDNQCLFRLSAFDRFPLARTAFAAKRGFYLCQCAAW